MPLDSLGNRSEQTRYGSEGPWEGHKASSAPSESYVTDQNAQRRETGKPATNCRNAAHQKRGSRWTLARLSGEGKKQSMATT